MKIHLFFFILLFGVTILPARKRFPHYGSVDMRRECAKARSELEPKYRFERCQDVKGICKPFCDDTEYDYGYCIKWRNQCCI
nr:beta-defensin 110 isoform X5 [Bubalus bubalis]